MPVTPRIVGSASAALLCLPAAIGVQGCFPTAKPPVRNVPPYSTQVPLHQPAQVISVSAREQFLGSAACVECHPSQAVQQQSRHARTLARVKLAEHRAHFQNGQKVVDPALGVNYAPAVRGTQCVLVADDGKRKLEATAYYALGSGRRAITYLGPSPEGAVQLRLSWYPGHGWDWTPGLRPGSPGTQKTGEVLGESGLTECLSCHSTALVRRDAGLAPELSVFNIGCESCHGPGKEHVQAVKRNADDRRMARLSEQRPAVTLQVCDKCHLGPGQVDLANPVKLRNLPRFPGAALALSGCATKGGANCMSCHDPHQDADQTSRADYNQACLSCHTATAKEPEKRHECPVQPRGDCVPCHMPQQSTGLPSSRLFHTHWIKAWAAKASPGKAEKASGN